LIANKGWEPIAFIVSTVKRRFNEIQKFKRQLAFARMFLSFLKITQRIKATHSIEVGAYSAEFSKSMLKFSEYVYAFEANPYVFNKFKISIPKEITYINLAISDKKEIINFYFKNYEKSIFGQSNSILKTVNSKRHQIMCSV
jgi:hypothetical protein